MTHRRRKYKPGSRISGTRYSVTRFIGSGAMGAVYEVVHGELDKVFVMKMLHRDLVTLEDPVRRMKSECRLLARMEHPNIVKVTDAGTNDENIPFFVMERLEGETLSSRMNRCNHWVVNDVVVLAIELLNGLAAAHSLGIVHRDIKPSNIFLTRDSGVKILDFGIAKSFGVDAIATARGVTLGTPRYMAPEQATGESADCRADLYALGIILYELLAGDHPFSNALTPVEMLIAQAGWKATPLPLERLDGISELGVIVARLLSKDPNARPSSAAIALDWLCNVSRDLRQRALVHSKDQPIIIEKRFCGLEPGERERARIESECAATRKALRRRTRWFRRYIALWGVPLVLVTLGFGARRVATSRANSLSAFRLAESHTDETAFRPSASTRPLSDLLVDGAATTEAKLSEHCRTQPTDLASMSGSSQGTSNHNSDRMPTCSTPMLPKSNPPHAYRDTMTRVEGASAGGSSWERAPNEDMRAFTRR